MNNIFITAVFIYFVVLSLEWSDEVHLRQRSNLEGFCVASLWPLRFIKFIIKSCFNLVSSISSSIIKFCCQLWSSFIEIITIW